MADSLTKPSITRLARKAGVKSMSDDCIPMIRNLIGIKLHEILGTALIINEERNTKTLMANDVYGAFELLGLKIARSNDLGTSSCSIK